MSRYRHNYPTQAEAIAFRTGVECIGDIDVSSEEPVQEGNEWVVYVTLEDGEDEPEGDECQQQNVTSV